MKKPTLKALCYFTISTLLFLLFISYVLPFADDKTLTLIYKGYLLQTVILVPFLISMWKDNRGRTMYAVFFDDETKTSSNHEVTVEESKEERKVRESIIPLATAPIIAMFIACLMQVPWEQPFLQIALSLASLLLVFTTWLYAIIIVVNGLESFIWRTKTSKISDQHPGR